MVDRPRTTPSVSSVPTAAVSGSIQAPNPAAPIGALDVNRLNFR